MSSDKKPVEHLQAKPYNPHDKRSAQQQNPQPRNRQPRNGPQSATTFFVLKQKAGAGGRKNPLLGYLLLFLMTALLATALLFGFIVLLVLIAVLLPIWLVVRLARNKNVR